MKIWFYRYLLEPRSSKMKNREGALLRVETQDGQFGYSDLMPWPEFGDDPLESQIQLIKNKAQSELATWSLKLAEKDASARSHNLYLLKNSHLIENHKLVTDFDEISEGQVVGKTLKIKIGKNLKDECLFLNKLEAAKSLRLDFNSKGTMPDIDYLLKNLKPNVLEKIEFIEDVFSYSVNKWNSVSSKIKLALDFEPLPSIEQIPAFQFLVLKPSRENPTVKLDYALKHNLKIICTSALDHPVGVAHSLAFAVELKQKYPDQVITCGCDSNSNYNLIITSDHLLGIGYDDYLTKISWTRLL